MDRGRDPTAGLSSGLIVAGILLTSDALSDPVLFDTASQHWLLAIDRDRIAVGFVV